MIRAAHLLGLNLLVKAAHFRCTATAFFALRACAMHTAGPGVFENHRRGLTTEAQHLNRQRPYFPLSAAAAAKRKEMQQFSGVHGHGNVRFAGVGQHEARVLIRALAAAKARLPV